MTLLALYWTADESPKARALIADVWLEDLEEFEPDAVADACREWRRTQSKRPSIVELRTLCIEAQANRAVKLTKRSDLTVDEIEAAGDSFAREHGFASMAEYRRDPGFRSVVIKIGPGKFHRFERIAPTVAPVVRPMLPRTVEMPDEVKRHLAATLDAVKAKQEFALPDDLEREHEVMAAE